MENNIRFEAYISGIVQGVGFRYHTRRKAISLGVKGYTKNLPDGSVYVVAEGYESDVRLFLTWLYDGPDYARVDDVKVEYTTYKNEFTTFDIRF